MKLRHGDTDIRLSQEPFPLYPGETLKQSVTPLRVVAANCALRIMVRRTSEQSVKGIDRECVRLGLMHPGYDKVLVGSKFYWQKILKEKK